MCSFHLIDLLGDSGLLHFDCVDDVFVIDRDRITLALDVVDRERLVILVLLATSPYISGFIEPAPLPCMNTR